MTTALSQLPLASSLGDDDRIPSLSASGQKLAVPGSLLATKAALEEIRAIAESPGDVLIYATSLLNEAELAEVRAAANLPTINITAKLQTALDNAYALYGTATARKGAQGVRMMFAPGQYLIDGLRLRPGMSLVGMASRYEVRIIQDDGARQPILDILGRTSSPEDTQRRTDVFLQDLFLKCNGLTAVDTSTINGIWLRPEDLETDEANRTGVIAHRVQCAGASGSGFYSEKRGRNWLHECQFTGHGEKGMFIQGPDCLLVKVYCGENGHEQQHIKSSATPMIDHVELGGGANPQLYPALYIENCTDFVINGGNCTGWVKVEGGEADPTSYDHGLHIRGTISNVIFTFKEKSFTDPDEVYSDLNGYIWIKNSKGLSIKNCMFRPAENRIEESGTGNISYEYVYRPLYVVYIQGAESYVSFDCPLPALDDPLWPAGTPAVWPGSAPTNTYDSITNNPDQALLIFTDPTPESSAWVVNRLRVLSGIGGASAGSSIAAGNIGELVSVESGSAVSLTTATVANVAELELSPGHWAVYGAVVFNGTGATCTTTEAGVSSNNSTISNVSAKRYAGEYVGCTTFTGVLSSVQIGPYNLAPTVTETRYLNARATFSAGTVTAGGVIEARRVA